MITQPKILIAEDELIVAENIAHHLRRQGYEVLAIVDSGEAAIQEAIQTHPDLILMDIMLQGDLDGVQATEVIHSQLQLPVIYMTAYADDTTLERAKRTDPYGYLVKPFKPNDLKTSIEVALQKRRSEAIIQAQYQAQLEDAATKLNHLLYRDALTGLANPLGLQNHFQQVQHQISTSQATTVEAAQQISVLCLSLDQFQRIRNSLGPTTADTVLCKIADRIQPLLGDRNLLGRTDLNELTVLLSPSESDEGIEHTLYQLSKCIAQPVQFNQHQLFITASIGVSIYPTNGQDLDTLMGHSRHVMHYIQQNGGNCYQFYSQGLHTYTGDQLSIEQDLRYALSRQELHLVFQPQISLQTGHVVGAETLIRWQHPQRGLVPPNQFIPIAEAAGLIDEIGTWVFRTACQQLQIWHELGLSNLRLSVNISGYQLKQVNLPQIIAKILQETQLNPRYLELELTESMLIADVDLAIERLQTLRDMGLSISIDDFGTGYSCLSHLHKLPFDTLKLDRSFVQNIHHNSKNCAISNAVIAMAHALNLKVVAEGVETIAEMRCLQDQGCDEMQGYLFSPPLLPDKFQALVLSNHALSPGA